MSAGTGTGLLGRLSADRIGGLIWVVFGAAIIYGSWVMDRLESLKIPPATAPGVVPGLLGIGIVIFGMILVLRRNEAAQQAAGVSFAAADGPEAPATEESLHLKRILVSWALCAAYGGLLLGRGIPYWPLTAAFLFLHILLLDDEGDVPAKLSVHRTIVAAILALAVSTVVALVFRYIFLVRLP
jgi:hypothetical protein